jgi:uncharacterized membrane protein
MNMSVDTLSRILHVLAAILLLGGGLFTRFVLMPAAAELPDDQHQRLKESIARRWRYLVALGIALLIFSGFYNYLVVMVPKHKGDGPYHMLMGIKILLAFVAFFFASALAGRSKGLAGIRQNAKLWLTVTIGVSTLVVAIAGYLKIRGIP